MTKAQKQEQDEAIEILRGLLPPGITVHTILEHVSRSGMQRRIRPVLLTPDADGQTWSRHIGYLVGKAIRERTVDQSVVIGGCGSDVGFDLVYALGRALYPAGFGCIGERCRSSDHSNGDRDRTPDRSECITSDKDGNQREVHTHWHRDGGYALRHEWL